MTSPSRSREYCNYSNEMYHINKYDDSNNYYSNHDNKKKPYIYFRQKYKDLWTAEKEGLLRRLQDEENRASMLTSEVMQLQTKINGPKTPQMTQFMVRSYDV